MSSAEHPKFSVGSHHDNRPEVLVNFIPEFKLLSLRQRLAVRYRLIDHPQQSPSDLMSPDFLQVRALVNFGPSKLTGDMIRRLPALELVVCTSAGVDKIDMEECRRRGIKVTNASAAFKEDVADYALGLLIGVLRKISRVDQLVRGGSWPALIELPLSSKISGKKIGIVGLGSIGWEVAKRLSVFGCFVCYHSRTPKPHVPFTYYGTILELACATDVLILCCALTDETYHIVDREVMSSLGKGGVIVNVGRGGLVDEKEMVRLLLRGELGGAGLDVFEDEPRIPTELVELDNVLLSPHTAVTTNEGFAALEDLVVDNLTAFFEGKSLASLVQD